MKKLIAIFAIAAVLVVVAGQVDDDLSDARPDPNVSLTEGTGLEYVY